MREYVTSGDARKLYDSANAALWQSPMPVYSLCHDTHIGLDSMDESLNGYITFYLSGLTLQIAKFIPLELAKTI